MLRLENRRACAWCGTELSPGIEPTTHGICAPCIDRMEEDEERAAEEALEALEACADGYTTGGCDAYDVMVDRMIEEG